MISVVINTLNEEANIRDCIESVANFASEIIVCDMHSEDRTVEIARELGATVHFHERTGFVEPARFFAITRASNEWVLVLDADERMTESLAAELKKATEMPGVDVVSFGILYWYFGGWVRHGIFYQGNWRRFFKKSVYIETYTSKEETVHYNFRSLEKSSKVLSLGRGYFIKHYAYETIEKYVTKTIGRYAKMEAESMLKSGVEFSAFNMFYDPVKHFILSFFLLRGFRDGVRGLIVTSLYAGYRLAVWANLWFLSNAAPQRNYSV